MMRLLPSILVAWFTLLFSTASHAADIIGTVRDESGGVLPGVSVELRSGAASARETVTDQNGGYRFEGVGSGPAQISFLLINFAGARRDVNPSANGTSRVDVVLHVAVYADVTVTGKRTFTNLADASDPAQNLVGIAQSASQGAITSRQLEARPMARAGEVLETVPGVIISQHSGEGKANQYYLRGFNLDHGTDFATTVAGMPVNMPTHGHGQGYSDLNFVIPELVSGVQYSKGPYFADQGDFSTAGAANINYVNHLDRPIFRASGGDEGYGRALAAGSRVFGPGSLLGAIEIEHNDGPWERKDDYRKVNGAVRYTRGDAANGLSVTGMGYRAVWNSTDQIPERAVAEGIIGRFGTLDATDGGDTYRYSGTLEWQRSATNASTKVTAYGIGYDLNLYSNFTFFLDDPVEGDQFHQADHRFISGLKVSHRRLNRWGSRALQTTAGLQARNDDISTVGLYHTAARALVNTVRQDSVLETSGAMFAQSEIEWTPWLRTLAGLRLDGYRFRVDADDPDNSGVARAGKVSPKGGLILGPWSGTELYASAGRGFHSNDARGVTIVRDPSTGDPADRVTPLVGATGAELGVRTVAIPHLQSSLALWTLRLDSELVFVGDAGTTEAGRPSRRYGFEWANYYAPTPWLVFDADAAWSHARFTDSDPVGELIPGSVETVLSGGVTVDGFRRLFASARLRYFGPRPLIEDDSVRSKATSLLNMSGGYKVTARGKVVVDVFNLLNARDSDIDYFYPSRLQGEPLGGVDDIHLHPTLPRTARLSLIIGI